MAVEGYGRRVSAYAFDQALSGGSNVVMVVVAAQLLDVDQFARLAIVFLVYGLVVVSARALIGIPVLMHPVEARRLTTDVVRSAWTLGILAASLTCAGAAAVAQFDAHLAWALLLLGVFAPALVVHDVGRFLAFATQQASRAITLDAVWLVASIAGIAGVYVADRANVVTFIAAWAGTGSLAAVLVHVFWPSLPQPGLAWLRVTRRASVLTFVESIILQFGALALVGVAGIFGGRHFIAGFSGAQVLARPISLVLLAMSASGLSEVAANPSDHREVVRATWNTSLLATLGSLVICTVLLAIPDRFGELILSDTWYATEPLLWAFSAYMIAEALSSGPQAALRGLRRLNVLVFGSIAWVPLSGVVVAIGYQLGGTDGMIYSVSVARMLYLGALIAILVRSLRDVRAADQLDVRASNDPTTT